jgi:hypothetical protein
VIFRAFRRPGDPVVVLLSPGAAVDSYGDPVEAWGSGARAPLPRAVVQDRDSVESAGDGRQRVVTRRVVYTPGDVGATERHRVEIDGEVWQVDGQPAVKRGLGYRNVYTALEVVRPTG